MREGWVEIRIAASVDPAELLSLLGDPEATGAWQENGLIRVYWPAERWHPSRLDDLRAALRRLGQDPTRTAIRAEPLADRDWNAAWAESVEPIRVGRRVVVRPSWKAAPLQPGDIELVLDPKQAFGSGHHATTRLLIERLEETVRGGERVLDAGTGSGILAMAALRLGAASAVGLDHDPVAVECARDYAAANGFGQELELRVQPLDDTLPAARFDLILANLDRRTLLETASLLRRAAVPGARLLLSGLLAEDEAEVAGALALTGLALRDRREQEGWLALSGEAAPARLHRINVSNGGVPKRPVPEARITTSGVEGDRQRSRRFHGGPDRAVCLYSLELIEALKGEGHAIEPGSTGENLTLAGVGWGGLAPGARLRIGERVRLEITDYTTPCRLNGQWFCKGDFLRISHERYPGWSRLYARVLAGGPIRPGDPVSVEEA